METEDDNDPGKAEKSEPPEDDDARRGPARPEDNDDGDDGADDDPEPQQSAETRACRRLSKAVRESTRPTTRELQDNRQEEIEKDHAAVSRALEDLLKGLE